MFFPSSSLIYLSDSDSVSLSFFVCVAAFCDASRVLRGLKLFPLEDVATGSSMSFSESKKEGKPSENFAVEIIFSFISCLRIV